MKAHKLLMALVLSCCCLGAFAQSKITGPSPSSRASIDLFDNAGDATPAKSMPASALQFPLAVKETQQGFLKVDVEGKAYWVRSVAVKVARESAAACDMTIAMKPGTNTASMPGVTGNSCK